MCLGTWDHDIRGFVVACVVLGPAGCGLVTTSGQEDAVGPVQTAGRAFEAFGPAPAGRAFEASGSAPAGRAFEAFGPAPAGRAFEAFGPAPAVERDTGPLAIGVHDAILLALENNRGFSVQRLGPARRATVEDEAAAAFDPTITASFSASRAEDPDGAVEAESDSIEVSSLLPTGTRVSAGIERGLAGPGMTGDTDAASVGIGITQPLARGAGRSANLVSIRQAALDTRSSEYELRGFAESLVAQVEAAYWDCSLAGRQIEIYEESLRLAEKQLADTQERVKIGTLAGIELAAAKAEVASRREALISVRGTLATARIRLLRLLNPTAGSGDGPVGRDLWSSGRRGDDLWEREVVLRDPPTAPEAELAGIGRHVEAALRSRPDLNQARLAIGRGELEVVKTRNGLLPKLDLFINLGKTGYSDSFAGAVDDLGGEGYELSGGLTFEWAIGNRGARARNLRAELSREEAALAFDNLAQLAQVDVRTAYIAVTTAREQIAATAATRELKEETLRAETEKLRIGKSTTFQVAQAQRDLVESQIAEVQALVGYLRSLVELYRVDGSLLERRGIAAPGGAPHR
jgi:outer membrane protein